MIGWVEEQEGLNARRFLRCLSGGQLASAACTLAFVGTDAWIVQQGLDLPISADYIGTVFLLTGWSITQLRVDRVWIWAINRFEDLLEQFSLIHNRVSFLTPCYKGGGPGAT